MAKGGKARGRMVYANTADKRRFAAECSWHNDVLLALRQVDAMQPLIVACVHKDRRFPK